MTSRARPLALLALAGVLTLSPLTFGSTAPSAAAPTQSLAVGVFFVSGAGGAWQPQDIDPAFRQIATLVDQYFAARQLPLTVTYTKEVDGLGTPLPPPAKDGTAAYLANRLARSRTQGAYFLEIPSGVADVAQVVQDQLQVLDEALHAGVPLTLLTQHVVQGRLPVGQFLDTALPPPQPPRVMPNRRKGLLSPPAATSITLKATASSYAQFWKGGTSFYSKAGYGGGGRGINIAVIHEVTGEVDDLRHYDTWYGSRFDIQAAIRDYLNSVASGRIIMMATADYNGFSQETLGLLRTSFGAKIPDAVSAWDDWTLIAKKGGTTPLAEKWSGKHGVFEHENLTVEVAVPLVVTTDRQPPVGSISITGGAPNTTTTHVTVDFSRVTDAGSGLTPGGKIMLSNDGTAWSQPEDFQPKIPWYLTRASGPQTVYAKVRDKDANWSGVLSARIDLRDAVALQTISPSQGEKLLITHACANRDQPPYVFYWDLNEYFSGATSRPPYVRTVSDAGSRRPIPMPPVGNIQVSCDDVGHAYVMANDNYVVGEGVFKDDNRLYVNVSSDAGRTWLPQAIAINPKVPSTATSSAELCADGRGNVYIAWLEIDQKKAGSRIGQVQFNVSHDDGRTWLARPIQFASNADTATHLESNSLSLTCNERQEVYVMWFGGGGELSMPRLQASFDAGRTWADISEPETFGPLPKVLVDGNGQIYLVRLQAGTVSLRSSPDRGKSWTPVVQTKTGDNPFFYYQLHADRQGNVYLFWLDWRDSLTYPPSGALYFNRSHDSGKTWLAQDVKINTNPYRLTGDFDVPDVLDSVRVVADDQGTVAAIWQDRRSFVAGNAAPYDLFMNYSTDFGDTWLQDDVKLSTTYPSPEIIYNEQQFVMGNGRLYALWQEGSYFSSRKLQLASLAPRMPANQPPVIDSVKEEVPLRYVMRASDPDQDKVMLSARLANGDPLPAALGFSVDSTGAVGTLVVTPSAVTQRTEYLVTFTATDPGGLSDTETVTIVVTPPAPIDAVPGMPVTWRAAHGVTVQGGTLTKTAAAGWGNAGAASAQLLRADGGVQFRVPDANSAVMVGVSPTNPDDNYASIVEALYVRFDSVQVYRNGTFVGVFGTAAPTDRLSVERKGSAVRFAKNGVVFYTSPTASSGPLLVDSALYTTGGVIAEATFVAATSTELSRAPVEWTQTTGAVAFGSTLLKITPDGWGNAGAASTQRISADGGVQFNVAGLDKALMCGLSSTNASASYDTIQYGVYLYYAGEIQVYERGAFKGAFGRVAVGDHLSVERSGTTVSYKKNGVVFYTSTVPSTGPLLVDSALYSAFGVIADAEVTGAAP